MAGRTRTFAAFVSGLALLALAELLHLVFAVGAEPGQEAGLPWVRVYLHAGGYILVLVGALLWVRDVRLSSRQAATRLADERRRLSEVRLNEAKLRAILNCATDYCIIVCDTDGLVTSYSGGGMRVLGYAADEVVDRMRVSAFHREGDAPPFAEIRRIVDEKGHFESEVTLLKKGGEMFPALLTVTALKDPADGAAVGFVGIAKDITEIKQAETALRRERDFVKGVIETSDLCVVGISLPDGRITMFNRGAERVSGYDRSEALGTRYVDQFLPVELRDGFQQRLDKLAAGGSTGVERGEAPIVTKDGSRRVLSWTNSVSLDSSARAIHVVAFGLDVTELRKMQAGLQRAMIELEEANAELKRMASTDFLTGLVNRRQAHVQFEREMARIRRYPTSIGVIMCDLDRFKPVNDTHGHPAGDAVLAHVAKILKSRARGSDIVARYGGEEFLLVLPEADLESTTKVANALRRQVRDNPARHGELDLPIRASFGVSVLDPGQSATPRELIARADEALYAAKGLGGNRVVSWRDLKAGQTEPTIAATEAVAEIQKAVGEIKRANRDVVVGRLRELVARVEDRNPFAAGHSERVTRYAVAIAGRLKKSPEEIRRIEQAALAHDLGKAGIPDEILYKAGTLTLDDWALVMQHPAVSCRIVADLPYLKSELPMIRHHHERPDGRGYPDGLSGTQIPMGARILAVADALDAMTSPRPYREPLSLEAAVKQLSEGSGTIFDEQVVGAALACAADPAEVWPLQDGRLPVPETVETS